MSNVQILRQKHTWSSGGGFEQAGASARGYDCWAAAGFVAHAQRLSVAGDELLNLDGRLPQQGVHAGQSRDHGTTAVYVDAFRWTTGLVVVSGIRDA